MTYEEKLAIVKDKGEISTSLVEPLDYYRFMRDGIVKQVTYDMLNGHKNIYELHCTEIYNIYRINDNLFITTEHCNDIEEVNNFMREMALSQYHTKYILLDGQTYKIELDPVETYE